MSYESDKAIEELVGRIKRLERLAADRSSQLAFSSIEDGAITSMDLYDEPTGLYGRQFDGSDMAMALKGLVPMTPTQPVLAAAPGAIKVRWDGLFVESIVAPTDFARVEVHASTDPALLADTADTLRGTFETPRGGEVDIVLPGGTEHYVRLVARNLAGARGPASVIGTATPQVIGVDQAVLDKINTDVAAANTAATAAKAATDGWTFTGSTAIDGGKIRADTVNSIQITAGAIIAGKLGVDSVLAGNVKAGEITAGKLAAASVIAGNLAVNSVQADNISAGAITALKLSADAINGKLITGTTVQTAASGARIVLKPGAGTVGQGNAVIQAYSGATAEKAPGEIVATTIGTYSSLNIYSPANTTVLNDSARSLLGLGYHPDGTKTQAVLSAKNVRIGQAGGEVELLSDVYLGGTLYGTGYWDTLNVGNFWVPYGGAWQLPEIRKTAEGRVELRGLIKSGSLGGISIVASQFRPLKSHVLGVAAAASGGAELRIDATGQLSITFYLSGGNNAYLSLDNIGWDPT